MKWNGATVLLSYTPEYIIMYLCTVEVQCVMIVWEIMSFFPHFSNWKKPKKAENKVSFSIGLLSVSQVIKVQIQKFHKNVTPMFI